MSTASNSRWFPLARLGMVATVAALLLAGMAGGLWRAGVALPMPVAAWPAHAVSAHAFLMVFAFMGTVIGIERAVAIRHRAAFIAPALSALAGACMLAGQARLAAAAAVLAGLCFTAVNAALVMRQPAAHTRILLAGALALLAANGLFATGAPSAAVLPWWLAFLVFTVAAERLEMTRLMKRRPGTAMALHACLATAVVGAAASGVSAMVGGVLYGLGLLGLALWLLAFDIARKTIRAAGLSRYMALCLLLGHGWLAVAGLAWMAQALGLPTRDAALHALGLGFVFSMMLGHAPVILPALARVRLVFGWAFYLPLALLHGSLLVRLAGRAWSGAAFSLGAAGNAAAIALFAATLLGSAVAWRLTRSSPSIH